MLADGYGYPSTGIVDQKWNKWTGRVRRQLVAEARFHRSEHVLCVLCAWLQGGRRQSAGRGAADICRCRRSTISNPFPVHPLTFKPEFIDAYELGTKNTLLDGGLTLNGDVFFYNYKGYQISQIVDRTSVNLNFDATVRGAELEATYEPLPGLKFSFAGGYEDTNINKNQYAIDLMDRTAGMPGWVVMKPSVGQSSNCIFPEYVAAAIVAAISVNGGEGNQRPVCPAALPITRAHRSGHAASLIPDTTYPITIAGATHQRCSCSAYVLSGLRSAERRSDCRSEHRQSRAWACRRTMAKASPRMSAAIELPNAPHFTVSLTGDYTMPVSANWAATLHSDFYWQSQILARVSMIGPMTRFAAIRTSNLALILTDASGWQVMGYVKNIFDHRHHRRLPEQRRFRPDHEHLPHRSAALWRARHQAFRRRRFGAVSISSRMPMASARKSGCSSAAITRC